MIYLICLITFSAFADGVSLDYLEGYLELQNGAAWDELYIGDEILSDAVLRLSDNGYAELLIDDAVVTLINDGNYSMSELISDVSTVNTSSFDLKKKLTLNSDYEKWQQEAIMGVRGAKQTMDLNNGMEDAYTYLNAGLELLAKEEFGEALVNFEEGWEFFEDDNCLFFSAVCYEALGQKRNYVKNLMDVSGEYLDVEFIAAYTIRKGDLLIKSLSYEDAVSLLEDFVGNSYESTEAESQKIRFLLGKGYFGMDNSVGAKKELQAARDMNPSTDVGKLAAETLENL